MAIVIKGVCMFKYLLLMLCVPLVAQADDSRMVQLDAVCRISTIPVNGHLEIGTGTVCGINDGYVYILTAGHVVQNQHIVNVECWHNGYITSKLQGQVLVSDMNIDAGMVVVPISVFGSSLPNIIALGDVADLPHPGDVLLSTGCALGEWPSMWRGHVLSYDPADGRMLFTPVPEQGRSGSAITNASGTKIVGVLIAKTDKYGVSTRIDVLRNTMSASVASKATSFHWDDCVKQQTAIVLTNNGPYILPHPFPGASEGSGNSQQNQGGVQGTWPTPPAPAAPIIINSPPPQQCAPQGPSYDPRVEGLQSQVGSLGQGLNKANSDIQSLGNGLNAVGKDVTDIKGAVGGLIAIHDKLETDAAAGGLRGKVASDVLSATSGTDSGLRTGLLTGGGVLGVILLLYFGYTHLKNTGHGPLGDLVDQLAAQFPNNTGLQTLKTQVDGVDSKLSTLINHASSTNSAITQVATAATQAATVANQTAATVASTIANAAAILPKVVV